MNGFWESPVIAALAIAILAFVIACVGFANHGKGKFQGVKIGKYHLAVLWFAIAATLAIDIWQYYHYSHRQITDEFPVVFTLNIAILSALIIIVALALAASGLAKLEAIEEKAKEITTKTATTTATEVATKRVREYLDSTKEVKEKGSSLYRHTDSGLIIRLGDHFEFAKKAKGPGERE